MSEIKERVTPGTDSSLQETDSRIEKVFESLLSIPFDRLNFDKKS